MADLVSQRNKEKLAHDGFIYTKDRTRGNKTYWRCEQRRTCNGRAVSIEDGGTVNIRITKEHIHASQTEEVTVQKVRASLKRKAVEQPATHPATLIREELQGLPNDAIAALPERQTLRRLVNRSRAVVRPANPRDIADLHLVPPYTNTISGQRFLLHDNMPIDNDEQPVRNRTVIFATDENLRYLFASDMWYIDGTFQVVPNMFYQLWTVHGKVANTVFPFAYVLMQNKAEEGYVRILRQLQESARELQLPNIDRNPTKIMLDFEKGAINACREVYPQAHICLCLFHFGQSLYRKVIEVGLQAQYNMEDSPVKRWVLSAIGLAFVPCEDVVETFLQLQDEIDEENDDMIRLEDIAEYLDRTYIRGRPARGRRRAVPPRYPLEMWNVYNRTIDDEARTNNAVEGWHHKFNKMVNKRRVSMFSLLDEIRNEQNDTEAAILQLNTGQRNIRQALGKKTVIRNERIRNVVMRYQEFKDNNDVLSYARSIGYNYVPMA